MIGTNIFGYSCLFLERDEVEMTAEIRVMGGRTNMRRKDEEIIKIKLLTKWQKKNEKIDRDLHFSAL